MKHDLLNRAAEVVQPVTESEAKCAITKREHDWIRQRAKERIVKHLAAVDDGFLIR